MLYLLSKDKSSEPRELTTSETETKVVCDFTKAIVRDVGMGNTAVRDSAIHEGCFVLQSPKGSLGMVEIVDASERTPIEVRYFKDEVTGDKASALRMLNVKDDESDSQPWRSSEGHSIFLLDNGRELTFVFGDNVDGGEKGSITFIR